MTNQDTLFVSGDRYIVVYFWTDGGTSKYIFRTMEERSKHVTAFLKNMNGIKYHELSTRKQR